MAEVGADEPNPSARAAREKYRDRDEAEEATLTALATSVALVRQGLPDAGFLLELVAERFACDLDAGEESGTRPSAPGGRPAASSRIDPKIP
ncbi:MAG: hypothetical protein N2653_03020 [Burkholderiales bacterium]|nr:hypothetical protein [Burkholderiales bacterium]